MMVREDWKLAYLEESFEELTCLSGKPETGVFLVKKKSDGKIYVKKYMDPRSAAACGRLRGLVNRNIAEIRDAAWNHEKGMVIEEFINGNTLAEQMEKDGLFEEERACNIIRDICSGLFAIHNMGMVHRDIKPENIMISNDGVVKIIDFGIIRLVKEGGTQDTVILGTAGYAAPEQFGFMQTDARADIYAVGALLNKLLTGNLPAQGLYSADPLCSIIRRCIEIDARNRFQTIQELKRTIETEAGRTGPRWKGAPVWQKAPRKNERQGRIGRIIRGIPGFRTRESRKNAAAAAGYAFLLIGGWGMVRPTRSPPGTFFLELIAVSLYLWAATLIAFNVADWDRRLYPVLLLPKKAALVVRIIVWVILFSLGVGLEDHVKYNLMGMESLH